MNARSAVPSTPSTEPQVPAPLTHLGGKSKSSRALYATLTQKARAGIGSKPTPHPCAFCGSEILKTKKTYCSSGCKAFAKRRRRDTRELGSKAERDAHMPLLGLPPTVDGISPMGQRP